MRKHRPDNSDVCIDRILSFLLLLLFSTFLLFIVVVVVAIVVIVYFCNCATKLNWSFMSESGWLSMH